MIIVLKHLAREFNIEPSKLRGILRAKFNPRNRRWTWDDTQPKQLKELEEIRSHLKEKLK